MEIDFVLGQLVHLFGFRYHSVKFGGPLRHGEVVLLLLFLGRRCLLIFLLVRIFRLRIHTLRVVLQHLQRFSCLNVATHL